jgi:hypothetical protein
VDQYAKRRKRSAREQRDHERLRQSKASFQASSLFEESVLDEVIVENTMRRVEKMIGFHANLLVYTLTQPPGALEDFAKRKKLGTMKHTLVGPFILRGCMNASRLG